MAISLASAELWRRRSARDVRLLSGGRIYSDSDWVTLMYDL